MSFGREREDYGLPIEEPNSASCEASSTLALHNSAKRYEFSLTHFLIADFSVPIVEEVFLTSCLLMPPTVDLGKKAVAWSTGIISDARVSFGRGNI